MIIYVRQKIIQTIYSGFFNPCWKLQINIKETILMLKSQLMIRINVKVKTCPQKITVGSQFEYTIKSIIKEFKIFS